MNKRTLKHPDCNRENIEPACPVTSGQSLWQRHAGRLRSIQWIFCHHALVILLMASGMFCSSIASSQTSEIDSLQVLLQTEINDTTRINALNALAWRLKFSTIDTAISLSERALALSKKTDWKKGMGQAYHHLGAFTSLKGNYQLALDYYNMGIKISEERGNRIRTAATLANIGLIHDNLGEFTKALECFFKSLATFEERGDKKRMAAILGNIGGIYNSQGDFTKALLYDFKVLKIFKELGNKQGISTILGNIGNVYTGQKDYPKALEYYFQALKMDEEAGNKNGIARHLANIGGVYRSLKDYVKALEYNFKGLKIFEELGVRKHIAYSLGSIGNIYSDQGDFRKAMEYYHKDLAISTELGNKNGMASAYASIGFIYINMDSLQKGLFYCSTSLELAKEIGAIKWEKNACEGLAQVYEKQGNFKKALEYFRLYTQVKDSLFNEEKSKDIGKLEAKHEFETAEAESKRIEEEKVKLEAITKSRRDNLQYSGILIFLVILCAGLLGLGRFAIPIRLAEGMIFFTFLLFFEFTLVLLDPYIENYSGGAPAYKLMFNAILAGLIFPLHSLFETQLKKRLISS